MLKKLIQKFASKDAALPVPEVPTVLIPEAERKQILRKAKVALLERKMELTKELLDPLLLANKKDGDALAIEGFRLFELGADELAAGVLQRARECGSDDPLVLKFLASALARLGKRMFALPIAEQARLHLPTDAALLNMLGSLYTSVDNYEAAAEALNKALEYATLDLGLVIVCNIAMLEGRGLVNLRKRVASSKGEQVRKQLMRQLLSERKRRSLKDNEARALLILCGSGPEYLDVAKQEADRLYLEPLLDEYTAVQLGRFYATFGDLGRATEMTEQAVDTGEGVTRYFLGFLLVAAGGKRWFSAWEMMDEGFLGMYAASRVVSEVPVWNGRSLGKKRLFVYQDQGFGDILMGLRLLKELAARGIQAVFMFKPGIEAVLATADTGVELLASEVRPNPKDLDCAAAVPMFSLVRLLKLQPEQLKKPTLIKALPERCVSWRAKLQAEKRLRVGVVVTGNPWRMDDWYRSLSPQDLEPFSKIENICWVNLSVDARLERDAIIKKFGMLDPTPKINDFADTAAVIDVLDVIVAIDCSVAHLAAALGKRVLVLVPASIDWRWQIGDDHQPWWPTSQTFRSAVPAKWKDAVSALTGELQALAVLHSGSR
ncbi:hypothetical protein Q9Q94_13715 [Uliginosibacterium sp. 31-16]|uniref:hypothetical protein n=1 Tax=Uliginosibacterium sp. 31-16 TaxID=3068315 RepID=UPI00273D3495|nr:hypothetical protein [Uliginosibacterium sp. 31-16]MDP5240597.1 hypothetical protein [Uliginosibacterium sp. 31-16]